MPRGFFITLEGLDGSGKTTQLKRLAAWMQRRGTPPVITRQPGGTVTGDRIRELLLDSRSTSLAPLAEMALMFADRAQAIAEVIEPALAAGKTVLCGRLQPDLTLLLLPSLEASLERARRRNDRVTAQSGKDEGRFEREQEAFYRRVWKKYREIARRDAHRVICIEGDLTIDEVHEQIVEAVAMRVSEA